MRYLIVSQDVEYWYDDYGEGNEGNDSYGEPKPVAAFNNKKDAENELKKLEKEQKDKEDRWGTVYFHILDLKDVKTG